MAHIVEQLERIATQCRLWAERANKIRPQHKRFPPSLKGMCAIATARVVNELHRHKVTNAVAIANVGHCFAMVDDIVVDVTASQFSRPNVVVAPHSTLSRSYTIIRFDSGGTARLYPWRIAHTFRSAAELREHQVDKWPREQIVPIDLAQGVCPIV